PGHAVYDRNPGVRLERVLSIPEGGAANVSRLDLGCHTGTHVDAPLHFVDHGDGAEDLLNGSGARWLVARGVRMIGIDYLSIGDQDAHGVLLTSGVVPVEGLDLRAVEPGRYELICLPLKVAGGRRRPGPRAASTAVTRWSE